MSISLFYVFTIVHKNWCSKRLCFLCIPTWRRITFISVLVLSCPGEYLNSLVIIMLLQSFQILLQPLWDYSSYPTVFYTITLNFILHIASNTNLSLEDSCKSLITNISVILRIHQWPACSGKCILTTSWDLLFGKEQPATGMLSFAGQTYQKSPELCCTYSSGNAQLI